MQWLLLIILIPYVYLITKIYLNLKSITPIHTGTESEIFVSVIVPCRNEEKVLPLLLSDIADQTYNPDLFELIIVNDTSSDSTFEVASGFSRIKNIKVLNSNGKGKKKAIRTGVEASTGSQIITADADCRVGKNWLKTIASFQSEHKPDMIICPVKLEGREGFFHRFQELEFLSLQGVTAGTSVGKNPVMCNGANLAFRKETYLKHAGNLHDELASGDDVFLLHNIKSYPDNKIMWLESAEAMAVSRISGRLSSFLNQRARWISKAGAYSDLSTKLLAIVTFVTISTQLLLMVGGFFSSGMLWVFAVYFALKSIPDYLVLSNTAGRYNKKRLLRWFIPCQVVYPFYVIAIVPCSLVNRAKWLN